MAAKTITTLEGAIKLYKLSFGTNSHWKIFEGKTTQGTKLADSGIFKSLNSPISEDETNDDDIVSVKKPLIDKSVDLINSVLQEYEDGYFTLGTYTTDKFNPSGSNQHTFKKGDTSRFDTAAASANGIGSFGNMTFKNPMEAIIGNMLVKQLEGGGENNGKVQSLELKLQQIEMEQRHQVELEQAKNSIGARLMGVFEDNFDTILDRLPMIGGMLGLQAALPAAPNRPTATTAPSENKNTTAQAEMPIGNNSSLAEKPLTWNPAYKSADAFFMAAHKINKSVPDINVSVLLARFANFAEASPNAFRAFLAQTDPSYQPAETQSDGE